MKYEKKNWNNDKGKKQNKKFPHDGTYSRGKSRRYGKHDEGTGEFNNMSYRHERGRIEPTHSDIQQGDEFNSDRPTYASASSNFNRSNNYDVNNNVLDNWGQQNNQYMAPPYKKGAMNQKANVRGGMRNNRARYNTRFVRNGGHRGSKFSAYASGDHNVNVNLNEEGRPPNEDNYDYVDDYYNSDAYYSGDGRHGADHFHHRDHEREQGLYSGSYNHDSYNPHSNDASMRHARKNDHTYEDMEGDNYADSYGDHHTHHGSGDSRKADINQQLSTLHRNLHNLLFSPAKAEEEKILSETNTTSKNKDSNESLLNQLSLLRNIPFNVKSSDGAGGTEGGKDDGLSKEEVDGGVNDRHSPEAQQKKSSQTSKTAMILDDLKKCLYMSNSQESKKTQPAGDNMSNLHSQNRAEEECETERRYNSSSYIDNEDSHFNVNNGRGYKTVEERGMSRRSPRNSSRMQNMFLSPPGNVEKKRMKSSNEEEVQQDRTSVRYRNDSNYYNSDEMDIESSISSDHSLVMDVYKNEVKEDNMVTSSGNIFPRNQIAESLRVLNTLQVDIERVCCYIKHFIDPPEQLFQVMTDVFVDKSVSVNSKIAIFYVYNHLIQELRNNLRNDLIKYYSIAESGLHNFVVPVMRCVLHEQVNAEMINKFYRCIAIWNERNVYSKIVCEQLKLLQKNPQKKIEFTVKNVASQAHSLLSNELSKFTPINFILKMPSVNNEHRKALEDTTLSALFENISKDTLKGYDDADVEEASRMSDKVMRMYGQELILINSQILELSSLICDNNEQLVKLQSALEKLRD
ncbi:hypothetical protein AK88_00144 [Plasmodium fragile]|uniref:CID domain-containing protein n=1 Tax=Plasmodium fragile TaxID=5857 RepID=A0A0D9QUF1_PLAFR|nr:uncharacterized protein AK88_00144 [Plasmodium fragile]KJP90296.1 hypothetical protein AK88_00144 [Plasmodium fragile]